MNNHYFRKEFLYDTFFYSVRTFEHMVFDNTTSQNIGGTDAWAVPHLKFFHQVPPRSPPLDLIGAYTGSGVARAWRLEAKGWNAGLEAGIPTRTYASG